MKYSIAYLFVLVLFIVLSKLLLPSDEDSSSHTIDPVLHDASVVDIAQIKHSTDLVIVTQKDLVNRKANNDSLVGVDKRIHKIYK